MQFRGVPASAGIVIGRVFKYVPTALTYERYRTEEAPAFERERLEVAMAAVEEELTALAASHVDGEIFSAHVAILRDPQLLDETVRRIQAENRTAESALAETSAAFAAVFNAMEDAYMKARSADIDDVANQVLAKLCDVGGQGLEALEKPAIVVAEDLTPSDTAKLNPAFVQGFVTEAGGRTSHSAIMARSMGLPAVVGAGGGILKAVENGDLVVLDAVEGIVCLKPSPDVLRQYETAIAAFSERQKRTAVFKTRRTFTRDGKALELAVNIGGPADLEGALNCGAEGVGLCRTEFLYMAGETMPDEATQYEAYKAVLEGMGDKPVVIRTLDIGGDKTLPYMPLEQELNPFLGHRAIRLCLAEKALFEVQLRALLRASAHGHLKIMFPMVATLEELREAKALLAEVMATLVAEGHPVGEDIEVGIMVEVPSTAVMAAQFAKEVDFFSIGTNDLIQYTFAADRMNPKLRYLYQPYHPAVLQLVKQVVTAAHAEGKWVGMCGEMAGDPLAIPLLVGLGIDEFSMSAGSLLEARALIADIDVKSAQSLVESALTCGTNNAVKALVGAFLEKGVIQ